MNSPFRAVLLLATSPLLLATLACQKGGGNATTDTAAARGTTASAAPATHVDSSAGAASAAAPAPATDSKMIDPNTVTKEQLATVPGMTNAAADALIAGRPYADMVAANAVLAKQLSDAQRKQVYTKVWKPIDLNTAKGEEILLIPGVGPRMRHEFEEYRPYKNIETFRREIGKYVDKNEVARLEQYVTIR
jgi:DNA uptake protein ComE-like DNA-binding protein